MRTHQYRYVGTAVPKFTGRTALGMWSRGHFKVQLDDCRYSWAQGWHRTPRKDWQLDTWAAMVARVNGMMGKALMESNPYITLLAGGVFPRGAGDTIHSVVKGGR
jgi:hypothetical protein